MGAGLPESELVWGDLSEAQPQASLAVLAEQEQEGLRAGCCLSQDSYPRFLKSDLYRDLLAEAVVPLETKRR